MTTTSSRGKAITLSSKGNHIISLKDHYISVERWSHQLVERLSFFCLKVSTSTCWEALTFSSKNLPHQCSENRACGGVLAWADESITKDTTHLASWTSKSCMLQHEGEWWDLAIVLSQQPPNTLSHPLSFLLQWCHLSLLLIIHLTHHVNKWRSDVTYITVAAIITPHALFYK